MWQADPGLKILDVRTPEEFVFVGHAPMATNIPFALQTYEWDPEKGSLRWELNPEFVAAVQAWPGPTRRSSSPAGPAAAPRWPSTCSPRRPATRGLEHPRRLGGEPGQGPGERLRRDADEERLEELRPAVELRDRPLSG